MWRGFFCDEWGRLKGKEPRKLFREIRIGKKGVFSSSRERITS